MPEHSRLQRWRRYVRGSTFIAFTVTTVSIIVVLTDSIAPPWTWLALGGSGVSLVSAAWLARRSDQLHDLIVSQVTFFTQQEFTSLYERSPVPYLTIETTGRIVEGNQAFVHLLRTDSRTLTQQNFFSYIVATETEIEQTLPGKIAGTGSLTDVEIKLLRVDGEPVWALLSVFPHHDRRLRRLALIDITERKLVDTAKSEFVALATHQLRTPIAAIRWNHELLSKKITQGILTGTEAYLERIGRNVGLMTNLIDDFLNVSKLEMGTFATATEEIVLADFFAKIFDEFSERITTKQLQVIPPVVGEWRLTTDPRLLHIIVSNLISNAVKYSGTGASITVRVMDSSPGCTIVVTDSGIGIPESEVTQLFTKFYRASNAHTQETEGTGLGLYVVKQSVEKLGGTITVTSVLGEGTTFTVQLPIVLQE